MGNHPIENIMQTTMENIRSMVDVNTIVGDTVVMGDGTVIIPISKVSFGFVSGGGEYGPGNGDSGQDRKQGDQQGRSSEFPFAGGAGAGVCISPMAFLVVNSAGDVNLLPVMFNSSYERMLGRIPELIMQVKDAFCSKHGKGEGDSGKDGKDGKDGKESWFSRNKRSRFDEDDAVDENYRPAKDEL